ncbi:hypothetical protein Btru_023245 [Bulinus truncatus]|nr:hypothetical protein Btru_023245 [Bulinus truncatus]
MLFITLFIVSMCVGLSSSAPKACLVSEALFSRGMKYVANCNQYMCVRKGSGKSEEYFSIMIQSGCKDSKNTCRKPGDIFSYRLSGKDYHRCQCEIVGRFVNYVCEK